MNQRVPATKQDRRRGETAGYLGAALIGGLGLGYLIFTWQQRQLEGGLLGDWPQSDAAGQLGALVLFATGAALLVTAAFLIWRGQPLNDVSRRSRAVPLGWLAVVITVGLLLGAYLIWAPFLLFVIALSGWANSK